jgi:hypothetical protein
MQVSCVDSGMEDSLMSLDQMLIYDGLDGGFLDGRSILSFRTTCNRRRNRADFGLARESI